MLFPSRRHRLLFVLFSVCLTATLLFNNSFAISAPLTTKKPMSLSVTENVRKTVLENGLTVLTKQVKTAPVVSVQVWYQIGSRDEAPGVNGIAHQLEHMLFKGTSSRPIQFGRLFSALGSDSNAFTSYDQTAYFGTVERGLMESLLELEADRMQNALINAEQLTSEKRVVISELQGYENSPDYRLGRAVMRAALPNSPYGLTIGGSKADVEKFTVEQVKSYYRNYYSPKNATLIIVGDFEPDATLAKVKEIFGKVPNAQEKIVKPQTTANKPQTQTKQPIVLKEPGAASLLQTVYPLVDINHPDAPVLDVLNGILAEGRNSRLYQALIESGLASNMNGYAATLAGGGWYNLEITAAPGQELAKIDAVLLNAIALLSEKGVTPDELNRAKTQLQASVLLNNRDIVSQAMQIGYDQTTARDYRFTDRYLAAIDKVSAKDVQRVAATYFAPDKRTVGLFEPTKQSGEASAGGNPTQMTENFSPGAPVDPAEVAKYLPIVDATVPTPKALPEQFTLTNGVKVLLLPDASTPTVTLSGFIKAGAEFDTQPKAGLAALTAENLLSGTQTKDDLALAKTLEDRGASLNFRALREGVDINGYSLKTDLPVVLETLADVVQNSTFPSDEIELSRQRAITSLDLELDDPARVARRVFQQAIYPANHPFHTFPTEESLKSLSREDVVSFYQKQYRPDQMVLTLVGDFEPKQVRSLLENALKDWKAEGKAPVVNYPDVPNPEKVVQLNPSLPGKTQAVTYLGDRGISRKDPRFYAALVLNQIVGGDTLSSRLGTELRDRQGLTYGIYSYFSAGRQAGPFVVSMQTDPEDANKAISSVRALLAQIHDRGVTKDEVAAAKRSLTRGYNVGLANPDELANTIRLNEVYGLGKGELSSFSAKIEAVTLEDVNQAAKELIQPDKLAIITAGGNTAK
ncbi:MAG: insulinase family protein [Chroococcus sp. CMT-3BRIN-NPC107]|jgi:zinc protease|nr:insulinase family protein [Chroococcus sp. CMT-3BRIN-NPC107]